MRKLVSQVHNAHFAIIVRQGGTAGYYIISITYNRIMITEYLSFKYLAGINQHWLVLYTPAGGY
jgi:hypothetical protein